jgi:hypothetical protein
MWQMPCKTMARLRQASNKTKFWFPKWTTLKPASFGLCYCVPWHPYLCVGLWLNAINVDVLHASTGLLLHHYAQNGCWLLGWAMPIIVCTCYFWFVLLCAMSCWFWCTFATQMIK